MKVNMVEWWGPNEGTCAFFRMEVRVSHAEEVALEPRTKVCVKRSSHINNCQNPLGQQFSASVPQEF